MSQTARGMAVHGPYRNEKKTQIKYVQSKRMELLRVIFTKSHLGQLNILVTLDVLSLNNGVNLNYTKFTVTFISSC